ncbi:beta-scruin-like [Mercenaria mercenaria]|uniref:beta-scruin-like n=1 Tax=Mercenaria mercenaria TaxID=6596 RepID=UPI00234EF615|nr:beta-scruin-like [Mercenaria mercenaria]
MSIRHHRHRPDYEFILLFNRATGSDRIYYFMLDPRTKDRMFPRMNTTLFHKLRNLLGFRPIVLNGMLYIVGGKDWVSGEMSGSTWRYNPDTGKWHACAQMVEPRCRFTANVLDDKIFVTGGEVRGGKVTSTVEYYDPGTDTWTPIRSLPRPRVDHASCVVGGTRLYVSGGISNIKHQCSNVFWVYDLLTDRWTDPCPNIVLPHDREKHLMVPVKNNIYVMAGRGFDQEVFQEKDEGHICSYCTKNDGEVKRPKAFDVEHPTMFHTRVNPGYIQLGKNIYLFGGKSFQKDREVTEVDYYSTKTRKWKTVFSLPGRYSYANIDCVKLTVPIHNRDFNFNAVQLYENWVMW